MSLTRPHENEKKFFIKEFQNLSNFYPQLTLQETINLSNRQLESEQKIYNYANLMTSWLMIAKDYEVKECVKNLKVDKGDVVSEGQIIADLVTNKDGITQLQFQIWKNNKLETINLELKNFE